ncbi:MAG: type IV pilus secretin PilQ, partial [Vicinamibacterales bacterium]
RQRVIIDFERAPVRGLPQVAPPASRQTDARPPTLEVDPIVALGLGGPPGPERAGSANRPAVPAPPVPQAEQAAAILAQAVSPASPPEPGRDNGPASSGILRPGTQTGGLGQAARTAQAAQGTTQPPPGEPVPGSSRTYSGNPVSLDFQQADLRAVLRVFAEISGLNIVIDPSVRGTVDVALRDVPWDQALDIILRANRLGYVVDGTVVRIAPLTTLADEETQRRRLAEEQALAGELRVLTKTLSYARAEELQPLLTRSALSQRGTVQIDPRTNTLIITDLPERLNTAIDLINALDRAQPQVEIEARIVQTTRAFARAIGVQWGATGRVDPALGNTTNLAFPNNGSVSGRTRGAQAAVSDQTGVVNLGVGAATTAVGLAMGSVNGAFNLDVALSALESSGNGRILSTPRVSTLNNVEAEVTQGIQIPLQTIANNTVTVSFKDAALTLKVTPQITAADTVIMKVALENATPDFARAAGPAAIPPINTQRAITTLLVNDGETTVIGGIYTSSQQTLTDRTPGLGSVPLLNWLFKRERLDDESRELLIFITPKIIKS